MSIRFTFVFIQILQIEVILTHLNSKWVKIYII